MGMFDGFGANLTAGLMNASNPFGLAAPQGMTQEQFARMPYLDLGAAMLANSSQRPLEAAGNAFQQMRQNGMDMGTKRLWAQQMQSQMQDAQEERDNKKKMTAALQALLQGGGGQPPMPEAGNQSANAATGPGGYTPEAFQPPQGQMPGMNFSPSERFQAQYWLGAGSPDKAMAALFKQSGGKQTREINGRVYVWDPETGTVGADLGAATSRQQTIPASVQTDVIKAKQAYKTLDKELSDYESLVAKTGYTFVPGQETDQVAQKRRNIQLQLKELYNLGVLNGPDLGLMDQMLYDPNGFNPNNWGAMVGGLMGEEGTDPASRAKTSAGNLRQMMKTIVDNKIGQANEAGGSYAPMQSANDAPPDVDPQVWENMTDDERALWQQN